MKRFIDIIASFFGLMLLSPFLITFILLIYFQDFHSPFYIANRVGKNGKIFKMIKLRSMKINADSSGVDSTSANDSRITPIGLKVRKYKLDELTQLWNVLKGDMSLVGPRPNVKRDTDLYSEIENKILLVRPGITDLSSIIFSDEGEILKDANDPDLIYNQIIRPWKSRLCLIYIEHSSTLLDFKIIFYTVVAIFSKITAIKWLNRYFNSIQIDPVLIQVAKRENELFAYPPPGMDKIVSSR
jgi:lipopolysaccharide/colanic/teichoic acid biosynthesis glycosyltransferase